MSLNVTANGHNCPIVCARIPLPLNQLRTSQVDGSLLEPRSPPDDGDDDALCLQLTRSQSSLVSPSGTRAHTIVHMKVRARPRCDRDVSGIVWITAPSVIAIRSTVSCWMGRRIKNQACKWLHCVSLHCDPAGCRESFGVFTFRTCFMSQPAGRYTYCQSKARFSWNIFRKISPYKPQRSPVVNTG